MREGETNAARVVGEARNIPARFLFPNDWNPNQMSQEMRLKERRSIERYGFLDPITVRPQTTPDGLRGYQIIDGEHRFVEGQALGITEFPCWVIDVDEDTAKELTPILNELRGRHDDTKLGSLLTDLMKRRDEGELRAIMPFDRARFDALIGAAKPIDWDALENRRVTGPTSGQQSGERWVERVFRMPADVAEVVDEAIARAKGEAGADNDWQGLEFVCAEYLGT